MDSRVRSMEDAGYARMRFLSGLLAILLSFLQSVPPCVAAEFLVFQKTYVRQIGSPITQTDSFSVLNPSSSWKLQAVNGSPEDTAIEKVSSSTLSFNGVDVLDPNDFNQNVSSIEIPVSVATENSISIQLQGKPGGQLTVEIVGEDVRPPVVRWQNPQAAQLLNSQFLSATLELRDDVSGLDPSLLQITLDGDSVLSDFSTFSQPSLEVSLSAVLDLNEGRHILRAEVGDLAAKAASGSVSFTIDITPPVITTLSPAMGAVLSEARASVSASYGDNLSGVDVRSVRLFLDGVDATLGAQISESILQFNPQSDLSDGQHTLMLQVGDLAGNVVTTQSSFTIQTIVSPPVGPQSGFIHGRVLNASTNQGLANAMIHLRSLSGEVRSDSDGHYQIPTPETGSFVVEITMAGFTSVQRAVDILASHDVSVEPAYLTPLDPVTTLITPSLGGVATDSSGSFQLTFPQGAVSSDLQVRITPLHEDRQLPGKIPENWAHLEAVYFEPRFTNFAHPATFRHPNSHNLPTGASVVLTLWNEDTLAWMDAGTGRVTIDGEWIEFPIVRFFCWYCTRLLKTSPAGASAPDRDNLTQHTSEVEDPSRACEVEGSRICPETGALTVEHSLPGLRTLGETHSLTFNYRSSHADPSVLLGADFFLETQSLPGDPGTLVPTTTSVKIQVEGQSIEAHFTGTQGSSHYGFLWNGRNARNQLVSTGVYPYTVALSNNYPATLGGSGISTGTLQSFTTTLAARAIVVNEQNSAFGAGWSLQGHERLLAQPDGTLLVTDGDGTALVFHPGPMRDVVIVNSVSNDLSIFFGHGDGSFQPQQKISLSNLVPGFTQPQPLDVAVSDFNADGFEDIAVLLNRMDRVAILLGAGGYFQAPQLFLVGSNPIALAVSDFDQDGMKDLVVSNQLTNDLSVLLGNGDGTFGRESRISVGSLPGGLAVADVNRDGIKDVLVASPLADEVEVLLGNGNGTFGHDQRVRVGSRPVALVVADVNADSVMDLAVANAASNDVSIVLCNGDGTFGLERRFEGANAAFTRIADIAAGDFNKDSAVDFVMSGGDDSEVAVLIGKGDGTLLTVQKFIAAAIPYSIVVEDFDRDGSEDLAVSDFGGYLSVLLGKPDGTFQQFQRFAVGIEPMGLAVGELSERIDSSVERFWALPGEFSKVERKGDGTYVRQLTDGTAIHFDARGFHTKTVDRSGNEVRYSYDAQDRLIRVEFPRAAFDLAYDSASGGLVSVTDSIGRRSAFLIDQETHLREISDPDGNTRQFVHDADHHLVSKTNERGSTTDYVYDALRHLKEVVFPARAVLDALTGILTEQREVRRIQPSQVQGLINTLLSDVGSFNNPAASIPPPITIIQDPAGNTTHLLTDAYGAPLSLTDSLGRTTHVERDTNGLATKITRPNGSVAQMSFDSFGNLTQLKETITIASIPSYSQQRVLQFGYSPLFGQLTTITDARRDSTCPSGCTTQIQYDSQGNPVTITDAQGSATRFLYDRHGNLIESRPSTCPPPPDPCPLSHHFNYDDTTGNLLSTTDSLNRTTELSYDSAGNVISSRDASDATIQFSYDVMNRLTDVTDAQGHVTRYAYDSSGNLVDVRPPPCPPSPAPCPSSSQFTYDSLNQLISSQQPAISNQQTARTKQYFYDLNRNLSRIIDPKGQAIDFLYDSANQLIRKDYSATLPPSHSATSVSYAYDSLGNLTLVQDDDSKLSFEYDSLGRFIKATTGDSSNPSLFSQPVTTLQYSYDPTGNRIGLSGPSQLQLSYTYDFLNRLIDISGGNLFGGATLSYDALSRLTRLVRGSVSEYSYDSASQLLSLTTTLSGNPVESFSYAYDTRGNRTSLTDRFGTHSFAYDALSRLTQAIHPSLSGLVPEAFSYDSVGNRLTSHLSTSYAYDSTNRLLEDDQFSYTYDANGNLIERQVNPCPPSPAPCPSTHYTYDVENQLIRVDLPDGTIAEYRYDALGRRIEKVVLPPSHSATLPLSLRYVYDNEDIVVLYDASGCWKQSILHGPDWAFAKCAYPLLSSPQRGED